MNDILIESLLDKVEALFLNGLALITSTELVYVLLIVLLFILPRLLLKFSIPMALTSFGLGIFATYGFRFFDTDRVIPIFSTLGIISLFLFAGIEVDLASMKRTVKPMVEHVGFRSLVIILLSAIFSVICKLPLAPAVVLALALSTPSTGFILDAIETSAVSEDHKFWIKLKAISAELVALGALLIFSQLDNIPALIGATITIVLLILVLPFLIKKLASSLEDLAPGSEFGFILMLAIIAGLLTKKLGVYYLVGAFIVGMVTGRYKRRTPGESPDDILNTLRAFSGFFMPFYFFNAGMKMPSNAFTMQAVNMALIFFVVSIPLKMGTIVLHRRVSMIESWKDSWSIAISLMPNLVFGLVLAEILKDKFLISLDIYGGAIIYTLSVTALSPLLIKFISNKTELELELLGAEPARFSKKKREKDEAVK